MNDVRLLLRPTCCTMQRRVRDRGQVEIVSSRGGLPRLTQGEASEASDKFAGALNGFFLANGVPQYDVFGATRYGRDIARFAGWLEDEPSDRTVETPLIDPLIYTPELIQHLQRTFLAEWPLWRVRVVSVLPEALLGSHVATTL